MGVLRVCRRWLAEVSRRISAGAVDRGGSVRGRGDRHRRRRRI